MKARIEYGRYYGRERRYYWLASLYVGTRPRFSVDLQGKYARKWTAKRAALRICQKLGLEVINE